LDVGCGPGQFARLCVEEGHPYVGIDFSQVAIEQGRKNGHEAIFHLVDVVKDKSLLKKGNYDTVTLIEFLEHIEEDLEVINSIPEGKNVVFSVPKYWSKAHIRAFNTPKSVFNRYDKLMEIKNISVVYGLNKPVILIILTTKRIK
jgi:2-polyprenyl-3-methyl-5-hydroxy-6-metoxy-1,4-benzoquinol methylase